MFSFPALEARGSTVDKDCINAWWWNNSFLGLLLESRQKISHHCLEQRVEAILSHTPRSRVKQQAQLSCISSPTDITVFVSIQSASCFLLMDSCSLAVILSFPSLSICLLSFSLLLVSLLCLPVSASPHMFPFCTGGGGCTEMMTEWGGWVVEITC